MAKTRTRVLLDTHVFLWIFLDPDRVPPSVKSLLRDDPKTEVYFSYASSWEIAIKFGRGKLSLPQPPDDFVRSRVSRAGWLHLPIELDHVLNVFKLPSVHKDPFDRLIISQARIEKMSILTTDPRFSDYDVDCVKFSDLT